MRAAFLCSLALVASAAVAEDIPVNSRVAAVTLYPEVVGITRRAELELPKGKHRLVLTNIPKTADLETLQVALTGARQTALLFRENGIPPRQANDPAVLAAEEAVKQIEDRIQAVRDEADRARGEAEAARAALGFLSQLGSNEGLAEAGAEALRDISRMIADEAGTAGQNALAAEVRARKIERKLEKLHDELREAEQALEAIWREDEDRLYLVVEAEASKAGSAQLELSYFSEGASFAAPSYEWHLSTGAQPEILLKRGFALQQNTGENWRDVDLTISTLEPLGQNAPSHLPTEWRRISDPEPPMAKQRTLALSDSVEILAEPVLEAPDIVGQDTWGTDTSGPGAVFHFGYPVSVVSGADVLKLEMDQLTTEVEVLAVAVPMRDRTAFRVARLTNTFGEDLLGGNHVPMFVDGKLVSFSYFDGLAAGQEAELGFGEIRGLRLKRDILNKTEGGRGVISRSNQQDEIVEISIENLTDEAWPIRLLDRVPFSEQDELEITWSANPKPSQENLEKRRGILAWEFDLAPGKEKLIRLETTLSWPEGKVLR